MESAEETASGLPVEPRGHRWVDRDRRVRIAAIASALSRGLSFSVTLVLIALASRYLEPERLGLWLTVIGFHVVLSIADVGLGNGLVNAVAESHGRERPDLATVHVSTAFYLLCGVSVVLGLAFAIVYPLVEWETLLNVGSTTARAEAGPAIATFVVCMLISLPMGLSQKIHFAYQESFLASVWTAVGSAVSLVVGVLVAQRHGGVALLTLSVAGGQLLGLILNSVTLFVIQRPHLTPRLRLVRGDSARRLYALGRLYFALAVAGAVGFYADNVIIARIMGADAVPSYAVPLRMFILIPTVLSFGLAPLWPAYTESISRGDSGWVRSTFERSLKLSLAIAVPTSIVLVISGRFVIEAWSGGTVIPTFHLLVGLGLWAVVSAVTGPLAMLLNGFGVIRYQIVTSLLMAVMNLGISILLVMRVGVAGAIYGTVISMLCCTVLPSFLYVPKLFSHSGMESES